MLSSGSSTGSHTHQTLTLCSVRNTMPDTQDHRCHYWHLQGEHCGSVTTLSVQSNLKTQTNIEGERDGCEFRKHLRSVPAPTWLSTPYVCLGPGEPPPSSDLHRQRACAWCTDTHSYTWKENKSFYKLFKKQNTHFLRPPGSFSSVWRLRLSWDAGRAHCFRVC